MNPDEILDNVHKYTARQLAEFIKNHSITLQDLRDVGVPYNTQQSVINILHQFEMEGQAQQATAAATEEADWNQACSARTTDAVNLYLSKYPQGKYSAAAWTLLAEINGAGQSQNAPQHQPEPEVSGGPYNGDDEIAWASLDKSNEMALNDFVNTYFLSPRRAEALQILNEFGPVKDGKELIKDAIDDFDFDKSLAERLNELFMSGKATQQDLIDVIAEDHNVISETEMFSLRTVVNLRYVLQRAGIAEAFIDRMMSLGSYPPANFDTMVPPLVSIPDGYTEIYFWGVPASGKTCAVGSIMSAMTQGTGVHAPKPATDSQGAGYMMPLAASFQPYQVCQLPPSTKVEETFEMRYAISDAKGNEHNVAFIDLSGELFECMYLSEAQKPLTPLQRNAINVLHNILVENRSKNPKIHFFMVEYGSENNLYKNLTQNQMLMSCLSYLNKYSILRDNTIGASIIITKADKARGGDLAEYVDTYYGGFYNGLLDLMNRYGIATHKGQSLVKRFPFSIGDVCFKNWCIYDPEWTHYIIQYITERSYGIRGGLLGKVTSGLKK